MTSISNSPLPNELLFEIFSYLEKSPLDLLKYRLVSKLFYEKITVFICIWVSQLKKYPAEYVLMNRAIAQIPPLLDLNQMNVIDTIKQFNKTIAPYKEIVNSPSIVSCSREAKELEQKLEDHGVTQLWDALSDDFFMPDLETVDQQKEWLDSAQNQSFLERALYLDLSGRQIVRLPRQLFKLCNLKKLDLSENAIEVLPESIKIWKDLQELNLYDNQLTYLPHYGIKYLQSLKHINLSENRLEELPRSIKHLKSIQELHLNNNSIKTIPEEIKACRKMEKLLVFGNRLTSLPHSIKYLSNLRILDVRFNYLQRIPREIRQCKSLEILNVSSNQISTVPIKLLRNLPSLRKFYVTDNPLTTSQKKLFSKK